MSGNKTLDAVIIGGGHNGLVCAYYPRAHRDARQNF